MTKTETQKSWILNMNKYSKHSDIEAVMQKAEKDIAKIKLRYSDYLEERTIPDSLLVEVKDCLASIRSALDYLWCKVPNAGSNAHFPITNSQNDFVNKTQDVDGKYTTIVEKWQSYNGDEWLGNFSFIRNKNEHLTLVPQTRKETKEFSVKNKQGVGFTARGCVFKGNISFGVGGTKIPIDERTQFPIDVKGVDIDKKIWVDFLFDGSSISPDFSKNISVLPFLKQSLINTQKIILDIEKVI